MPCKCCGQSGSGSGSDSGSGSGSGQPVPRFPICGTRSLPAVLYATFSGALASWGTLPMHGPNGPFAGVYDWTFGTGLPVRLCEPSQPAPSATIQFCGDFLGDTKAILGFSYLNFFSGTWPKCQPSIAVPAVVTVPSWNPFFASISGTIIQRPESALPCPCLNEPWSMVVTETPP